MTNILAPNDEWYSQGNLTYRRVCEFDVPDGLPDDIERLLLSRGTLQDEDTALMAEDIDFEVSFSLVNFVFSHMRIDPLTGLFVFRFKECDVLDMVEPSPMSIDYPYAVDRAINAFSLLHDLIFPEELGHFSRLMVVVSCNVVVGFTRDEGVPHLAIDFHCGFRNPHHQGWHDLIREISGSMTELHQMRLPGQQSQTGTHYLPIPFHFHGLEDDDFSLPYHLPGDRFTILFYIICGFVNDEQYIDGDCYRRRLSISWSPNFMVTDYEGILLNINTLVGFYATNTLKIKFFGDRFQITLYGIRLGMEMHGYEYSVRAMSRFMDAFNGQPPDDRLVCCAEILCASHVFTTFYHEEVVISFDPLGEPWNTIEGGDGYCDMHLSPTLTLLMAQLEECGQSLDPLSRDFVVNRRDGTRAFYFRAVPTRSTPDSDSHFAERGRIAILITVQDLCADLPDPLEEAEEAEEDMNDSFRMAMRAASSAAVMGATARQTRQRGRYRRSIRITVVDVPSSPGPSVVDTDSHSSDSVF